MVDDVSFSLSRGKVTAVIGESGSGKTSLCRSLTRLFPIDLGVMLEGSVRFDGREILNSSEEVLRSIRRGKIRYIFQDGRRALNPVRRVRTQMQLAARDTIPLRDRELCAALADVGIMNGLDVLDSYPHQLSGGMAQRVLLAMAMLGSPELLIADEPTGSVDPSLKFQLLDLLRTMQRHRSLAVLLVTHDLEVAREYSDQVLLLYAGRVVESGPSAPFFAAPFHPYAKMLLEAERGAILQSHSLQGRTVSAPGEGCRFYPHCLIRVDACMVEEPDLAPRESGRKVRCPYSK